MEAHRATCYTMLPCFAAAAAEFEEDGLCCFIIFVWLWEYNVKIKEDRMAFKTKGFDISRFKHIKK